MLCSLQVRDFAIVDDVSVELGPGLTVLSGETGAGKSLLVDALNLALGERASQDMLRVGATSAEVNAVFEASPDALAWLVEHDLAEEDGACMLRRVVGADGRSRAYINGRPVPVSRLRALGDRLVDVHGQHAHQSLLRPTAQREVLDDVGGHGALRDATRASCEALSALRQELTALTAVEDPLARLDYLRFQVDELTGLGIEDEANAPEAVLEAHRRAAHAAELMDVLDQIQTWLASDVGGVEASLGQALKELEAAARLDSRVGAVAELLAQAAELAASARGELRALASDLDTDPAALAQLESRLEALQDLARKHRVRIEELPGRLASLREETDTLEGALDRLRELDTEIVAAREHYLTQAGALSTARRDAGEHLAREVNALLPALGMPGAEIAVVVSHDVDAEPAPHGLDAVRLEVRTNPGAPMLPLGRVASGGELSRIALAVQSVASTGHGVPCIVFDEVDVGIGGAVAEVVGRRMRDLAAHRQVLSVTHQAQVAALAHQHLRVHKQVQDRAARTHLEHLDEAGRVEEVARMLGGVKLTRRTREHARELIASAATGTDPPA